MAKPRPALSRLLEKVRVDSASGCWVFIGALTRDGYGAFRLTAPRQVAPAHRVAYQLLRGPIAEGLHLDHLCLNRACINPDHLEPVTNAENARRSWGSRRAASHCARGHEFDEFNTFTDSRGRRGCIACRRLRDRTRKKRDSKRAPAPA